MEDISNDKKLEAVLFYKAAPMSKANLLKLLEVEASALEEAISLLQERLQNGALRLIVTEREVSLVTAPELDSLLETIRKDELKRDIGKAGAETLAIIAYRGPIARSEIDRIRGVKSSYILRNLETRGLVTRTSDTKAVTYAATPELFAHLGLTDKTQLPQFTEIMGALDAFETQQS